MKIFNFSFLFGLVFVQSASALVLMPRDLPDWQSDQTQNTMNLSYQCGLYFESYLRHNNAYHYVEFDIRNSSSQFVFFDFRKVQFQFEPGPTRFAANMYGRPMVMLEPHNELNMVVPTPAVYDFDDANFLMVTVPVFNSEKKQTCAVKLKFKRNLNKPKFTSSASKDTTYEVYMGFGKSFGQSKALRSFSQPHVAFDLSGYYYFAKRHGVFLSVSLDSYGDGDPVKLASVSSSFDQQPDLGFRNVYLGYSYRKKMSPYLTFNYDIGPGRQTFLWETHRLRDSDIYMSSSSVSFNHRLNASYLLLDGRSLTFLATCALGVSFYHYWLPFAHVGGIDAKGHMLGAIAYLKIGL